MKIKVGDWVKVECLENTIGRVTKIDNLGVHVYIGKPIIRLYTGDFIKYLIKLPIKFKPFEINRNLQVYETRVIKGHKYPIQFMSTDNNFAAFSYCKKGVMFGTIGSRQCVTRDQAKDWLELQYATMIAKERGLI